MKKSAADRDGDQRDHEQAIARQEEEVARQRRRQPAGNRVGQALRAPDVARDVLEDIGEAEGEQQAIERIATVDAANEKSLDDQAQRRRQERRDQQAAPEPDVGRQRIGNVRADGEKSAVREIDDAAQVENQRKAKRHQRIECADDQPVEDIEQQ